MNRKTRSELQELIGRPAPVVFEAMDLDDPKKAAKLVGERLTTLRKALNAVSDKEGFLAHDALAVLSRHSEVGALQEWQQRADTVLRELNTIIQRLGILSSDMLKFSRD